MRTHSVLAATALVACVSSAHAFELVLDEADFTPDEIFSFDNLTPGPITDGLAIAPGVQFSTDFPPDTFLSHGGEIVDTGSGNIQLAYSDFQAGNSTFVRGFMIKFDTPIIALGATWNLAPNGAPDSGNGAYEVFNAAGEEIIAFGAADMANAPLYRGGMDFDEPVTYVMFSNGQSTSGERFWIDNLAVQYFPTPGPVAMLGLAGLAAARRRRA